MFHTTREIIYHRRNFMKRIIRYIRKLKKEIEELEKE